MGPCPAVTPKNCLAPRGISVLEKLVKTCPVWLQLGLGRAEAARILHREAAGVSPGSLHQWGRYSRRELRISCPCLCLSAPQPG